MNASSKVTSNTSGTGLSDTFSLNVPYTAAEMIIAVTATLGNLLVCMAVVHDKKLRTVTNYFLTSLSVADVCVGAIAIPCAILTSIGYPHNNLELCLLMLSILIMLIICSTLNLLSIAVDRYVAILNPLRYRSIMTPRNALISIIVAWLLSVLSGLLPLMGWHKTPLSPYCLFTQVIDMTYMFYFFTFTFFILPLTSMLLIYARIFSAVRKHINHGETRATPENMESRQETGLKREIKTATSLFTIIFLFVLCWAPLHVVNGLILLCSRCSIPPLLVDTGIILSHANSALNPIVYAYKLKSFRDKFKVFIRCRDNTITPEAH
ncbi:hypothetical protein XELAEV_18026301mg [Xenopus laevis]|uniref:G-protein coupled receptors family 1 profile domain-containing protein n=1 Tax=Xenopus laevis TaxID=8355 RepID=A0A974HIV7_XENLA|nr:hypothetical protein XELAEV_18026301mg [Xenopus laevis]